MADHEGERSWFPESDTPERTSPLEDIKSGLKVWADVGLTIGKQVEDLRSATHRLLGRLERNTPIPYMTGASATANSAGQALLVFGSPDQGTYWEVNSISIGSGLTNGTEMTASVTGTATLYVSAYMPLATGNTPGASLAVDRATTLPNSAFYGGRDIVVSDQEYLFLIVNGANAGQLFVANIRTSVINVAAAMGSDVNYV